MKKMYNKPLIYIESFTSNEFVANCNVIITSKDKNDVMSCINPEHKISRDHTVSGGRVENVFTTRPVCGTLIKKGSPFSDFHDGVLLDYFENDAVVYIFNDDNDHALTDNPIRKNSGDDRCFGGFKNPVQTSTETTIVPVS